MCWQWHRKVHFFGLIVCTHMSQRVPPWLRPFGCDHMSLLILHRGAWTLCRATGASETRAHVLRVPQAPAHTVFTHTQARSIHPTPYILIICFVCRLPGNSSSSCNSNTKSTSCSSRSRWDGLLCVCVRVCNGPVVCMCAIVSVCVSTKAVLWLWLLSAQSSVFKPEWAVTGFRPSHFITNRHKL